MDDISTTVETGVKAMVVKACSRLVYDFYLKLSPLSLLNSQPIFAFCCPLVALKRYINTWTSLNPPYKWLITAAW